MRSKLCYWSVATGKYGALMEHCVRTAREAGVFKEFHVLTDRPLKGCECYDAYAYDQAHGLFKLHYLKVGMSRLNFDYFVWLDADTVFARNPVDMLAPLGRSPIHVPLEVNLAPVAEDAEWKGTRVGALRELMEQQGVVNEPWLGGSAFWIVHHEAIEGVYDPALGFWHKAKAAGRLVDVSASLSYAPQILCADSEAHRLREHPDLWAGDHAGVSHTAVPNGEPWTWQHPLDPKPLCVQPAIIHLPAPAETTDGHWRGGPPRQTASAASCVAKAVSAGNPWAKVVCSAGRGLRSGSFTRTARLHTLTPKDSRLSALLPCPAGRLPRLASEPVG